MKARYDGLADEYGAFVDAGSSYFATAKDALRRLLGPGPGRCLDVGCGGGHLLDVPLELGWQVVGVDVAADHLRTGRDRHPEVEFLHADAAALPFDDSTFDAVFSTFTHTDFDDFAGAVAEARRVLRRRGRLVYVGTHPCFVGPTQEHAASGVPRLHPGYRRAGRWASADAPGTTPDGWRQRLGSFIHLPSAAFSRPSPVSRSRPLRSCPTATTIRRRSRSYSRSRQTPSRFSRRSARSGSG